MLKKLVEAEEQNTRSNSITLVYNLYFNIFLRYASPIYGRVV